MFEEPAGNQYANRCSPCDINWPAGAYNECPLCEKPTWVITRTKPITTKEAADIIEAHTKREKERIKFEAVVELETRRLRQDLDEWTGPRGYQFVRSNPTK